MNTGFEFNALLSSIFYSLLGLFLMVGSVMAVNSIFKLDLRKELLEEHNVASAIVLAGIFLSIALIIASAIHG